MSNILSDLSTLSRMRSENMSDAEMVSAIIMLEIILLTKYRESLVNVKTSPIKLSYEEECWLRGHQKLRAIKLYRERTNCRLVEAKADVETAGIALGILKDANTYARVHEVVPFEVSANYK